MVEVINLKKYFPVKGGAFGRHAGTLKAVDGISFRIGSGETFGLVGESGCGKSTVGRTLLKLYEPSDGSIIVDGVNVTDLEPKAFLPYRKKLQIIFQDPYASLDPRMTVAETVGEAFAVHGLCEVQDRDDRVRELLELVGLKKEHMHRYPHEFSGGQRQRVGIARALAVQPEFIVCDEPISALDVSIQAQIINMLDGLQKRFGISYLFVSHDLSMVRYVSKTVAVMYLGRIVEVAGTADLYTHPLHPYTRALLSAVPKIDPSSLAKRIVLGGEVPSPLNPPSGCPFRTRCSIAQGRCAEERPFLEELSPGHQVACFFPG